MFRYWTEDSPEARDFSTILVGLLSESTQGAADPNELLRIAGTIRSGNRDDWTRSFLAMAELMRAHDDPQKLALYRRAVACFSRGLSLSAHRYEPAAIAYDGHCLDGYFSKLATNGLRASSFSRAPTPSRNRTSFAAFSG